MSKKKYLFSVNGEISKILSISSAEIEFNVDGKIEKAFLKKDKFFHNGRLVPRYSVVPISKFVRENMKVKFSCHMLDNQDGVHQPYHVVDYKWYAMMCWVVDSPQAEVTRSIGLSGVAGTIVEISKRHGVLASTDYDGNKQRILFRARNVYLHKKKLSSSKKLNTELCLQERMFCDAVPCFPGDNKHKCNWIATCAFQGPRPRITNVLNESYTVNQDVSSGENHRLQPAHASLKSLRKIVGTYTTNPQTLFTTGYGHILAILNEEFGVILGCFQKNVFQTVLFHRKNAFLFKLPLARAKLNEIFLEGDRVKFIATGAPANFHTDWIAVHVSVSSTADSDDDALEM